MSNFETRYGRAKRGEQDRRLALVLGSVLGVALIAWIFVAVFTAPPKVNGEAVGFTSDSPLTATVKAQITAPIGAKVTCGVAAVNAIQSAVGFKQIEYTATKRTTAFIVVLNTTEQASAGMVSDCELR